MSDDIGAYRPIVKDRVSLQEQIGQQWNIVLPFAQGRYVHRDDVQSKQEIPPKLSFEDQLVQIPIGRGNHWYVGADLVAAANPRKMAILQHLQKL